MIFGSPLSDQELWKNNHQDNEPKLVALVYHTAISGGWSIPYDPKAPKIGIALLEGYFSNIQREMIDRKQVPEEVQQLYQWKLESLTKEDLKLNPHGFMQCLVRKVDQLILQHGLQIVGLSVEVKC